MSMNNLCWNVLQSMGLWLIVAVEGYSLELMVDLWSNAFYLIVVCFS